jgi:hyperosmotically inducible protein
MSLRIMQKMLPVIILIPLVVIMYNRNKHADIKTAVNKAIATGTVLSTVSTSVEGGTVTLSGEVRDDATRVAAEAAAKKVYGVKSVTNNLLVNPTLSFAQANNKPKNVSTQMKEHPVLTATVQNGVTR